MTWQAIRLTGGDALAVRASKRLRSDELLVTSLGATILRKHLDDVPLWSGDHIQVRQLVQHFAQFPYLPRLRDPGVLLESIRSGVALLTWRHDSFAYAEAFDGGAGRYQGLRGGQQVTIVDADAPGLLVRSAVAEKQLHQEQGAPKEPPPPRETPRPDDHGDGEAEPLPPPAVRSLPRRFQGSVVLDPTRLGRDAGRVAEEVVAHLAGLPRADVRVTLEIAANVPGGVPDSVVRIVTENGRTLKFETQGFEDE